MAASLTDPNSVLGSPLRNLIVSIAFVLAVMVLATLGYMAAGWSFADASYMVLITVYSVGYNEVHPIDTAYLHAVTVGTIVLGCTGMILLTGALIQFVTAVQLGEFLGVRRMERQIGKLDGHVVICGMGRIGATLARDLAAAGMPLVVIERATGRFTEASTAGHLCIAGDATEEEVLRAAGIERARVLATVLPDDAANVFITLSARNLNPAIEIIARGEAPTTENKLRQAGADHVVLPTHIGAERIARMILFPASDEVAAGPLRVELAAIGLALEQVRLKPGAALVGCTLSEAEQRTRLFIVQVNRGEARLVRPAPHERLAAGDELLVVAREGSHVARAAAGDQKPTQVGRTRF